MAKGKRIGIFGILARDPASVLCCLPLTSRSSDPAALSLGSGEQPAENVGIGLAQPGLRDHVTHLLLNRFQSERSSNRQHGPGAVEAWKHVSYLISLTYF